MDESREFLCNLFNGNHRKWLTMTNVAAIACLWFVFDNGNLFSTAVLCNYCSNFYARNDWGTNAYIIPFGISNEHGIKRDFLTKLSNKLFYLESFTFSNKVLLAAGGNNCVHHTNVVAQALRGGYPPRKLESLGQTAKNWTGGV